MPTRRVSQLFIARLTRGDIQANFHAKQQDLIATARYRSDRTTQRCSAIIPPAASLDAQKRQGSAVVRGNANNQEPRLQPSIIHARLFTRPIQQIQLLRTPIGRSQTSNFPHQVHLGFPSHSLRPIPASLLRVASEALRRAPRNRKRCFMFSLFEVALQPWRRGRHGPRGAMSGRSSQMRI